MIKNGYDNNIDNNNSSYGNYYISNNNNACIDYESALRNLYAICNSKCVSRTESYPQPQTLEKKICVTLVDKYFPNTHKFQVKT